MYWLKLKVKQIPGAGELENIKNYQKIQEKTFLKVKEITGAGELNKVKVEQLWEAGH